MAREHTEPAHGTRGGEPYLVAALWTRAGLDAGEFWAQWRAAVASATAGLAGGGVHGERVEHETSAPTDSHERYVSDGVDGGDGEQHDRSRQHLSVARAFAADGGGDRARQCAACGRQPGPGDGRAGDRPQAGADFEAAEYLFADCGREGGRVPEDF